MGRLTREEKNPQGIEPAGKPRATLDGRWGTARRVWMGDFLERRGDVDFSRLAVRQEAAQARLDFIGIVALALARTYEAEHLSGSLRLGAAALGGSRANDVPRHVLPQFFAGDGAGGGQLNDWALIARHHSDVVYPVGYGLHSHIAGFCKRNSTVGATFEIVS